MDYLFVTRELCHYLFANVYRVDADDDGVVILHDWTMLVDDLI